MVEKTEKLTQKINHLLTLLLSLQLLTFFNSFIVFISINQVIK